MVSGISSLAAVSIYSLEGLAGLGGRIAFGLAGDRFGARRVLMAGLLIQALAAGSFMFAQRLGEVYAVAAVVCFPHRRGPPAPFAPARPLIRPPDPWAHA